MSPEPNPDDPRDDLDDQIAELDRELAELDRQLAELDGEPPPPPPLPVRPLFQYGTEIGFQGIEAVEWLWEPYLAFGALSVLDGDPEVGKSLFAIDLAARLSVCRELPDGRPAPRCPANPDRVVTPIFANAEDSVRRMIVPRMAAAGGNPNAAIFLGGVGEDGGRPVRFPDDLLRLAETLHKFPGSFVVLDPITALLARGIPLGSDQAVREVLTPLARLAARTRSCILMGRHLAPRQSRRALYRGAGSIGIVAACRTALVIERHPDDPDRRVLAVTKSNLGPKGPSLGFRVREAPEQIVEWRYPSGVKNPETGEVLTEPTTSVHLIPPQPVIDWEGVSALTADDLCHAKPDAAGPGLRAAAWLKKVLANGPIAATEIEKLAAKEDFGYATVRLAKAKIKIESRRVVINGKPIWEWMLPTRVT